MQSLGNDFVVLDGVTRRIEMSAMLAQRLADRHFGIGCDQILLAEAADDADFRFRIFNQDGSEVEQCGNGARCFARFLLDRALTEQRSISVRTLNTFMTLAIQDNGDVQVNMGAPVFEPALIPLLAEAEALQYPIGVNSGTVQISALSMGNPHAVMIVDDVEKYPVLEIGAEIERHPSFPARVNAGFMQVVDRQRVRLRVFERGAGETLGCGSGACAAMVAGHRLGILDQEVVVSLPGGEARVSWKGEGSPVLLTGPAHTVFCGKIDLQEPRGRS